MAEIDNVFGNKPKAPQSEIKESEIPPCIHERNIIWEDGGIRNAVDELEVKIKEIAKDTSIQAPVSGQQYNVTNIPDVSFDIFQETSCDGVLYTGVLAKSAQAGIIEVALLPENPDGYVEPEKCATVYQAQPDKPRGDVLMAGRDSSNLERRAMISFPWGTYDPSHGVIDGLWAAEPALAYVCLPKSEYDASRRATSLCKTQSTLLAGGNYIHLSSDNGHSWEPIKRDGTSKVESICYLDNGQVLAGMNPSGNIYRSTDNGYTWTLIQRLGTEQSVSSICYLGNGRVLAGTYPTGQIYVSTDNGLTWQLVQRLGDQTDVRSILYVGSNRVLAGTYPTGQIYVSTDNGSTWQLVQRLGSSNRVEDLLNLGNGRLLAATGANAAGIYKSTDNGSTWQYVQRLGSEYTVYSLVSPATGVVLAGTGSSAHIYKSTDGGDTWQYIQRLGNQRSALSLCAIDGNNILAGTGDSLPTIYSSADGGNSWSPAQDIGHEDDAARLKICAIDKNGTWEEDTVTWNNMPSLEDTPLDSVDNPQLATDRNWLEITPYIRRIRKLRDSGWEGVPPGFAILSDAGTSSNNNVIWQCRDTTPAYPAIMYWDNLYSAHIFGGSNSAAKLYGLPGNNYYVIYRIIDPSGRAGKWSAPQRVSLPVWGDMPDRPDAPGVASFHISNILEIALTEDVPDDFSHYLITIQEDYTTTYVRTRTSRYYYVHRRGNVIRVWYNIITNSGRSSENSTIRNYTPQTGLVLMPVGYTGTCPGYIKLDPDGNINLVHSENSNSRTYDYVNGVPYLLLLDRDKEVSVSNIDASTRAPKIYKEGPWQTNSTTLVDLGDPLYYTPPGTGTAHILITATILVCAEYGRYQLFIDDTPLDGQFANETSGNNTVSLSTIQSVAAGASYTIKLKYRTDDANYPNTVYSYVLHCVDLGRA